jgi:hypothetical protein
VVGNPPYQGASRMTDATYLAKHYPKAKADLFAAFLERGLQLATTGGLSGLVTMRNWMFIQQYTAIREYLLENFDLRSLGDFDRGAFDEVPNEVLAVTLSIFQKTLPNGENSVAMQPTALDDNSYDRQRTNRKRAAVLAQVGRFEFESDRFAVIKEKPIIYWWDEDFYQQYSEAQKLEKTSKVRRGLSTCNNARYLRNPWEVYLNKCDIRDWYDKNGEPLFQNGFKWVPYIKGAAGKVWFEPLDSIILWQYSALEKQLDYECFGAKGGNGTPSRNLYFEIGVAFSTIGAEFSGRIHRFRSVIGDAGSSIFGSNCIENLCVINTSLSRQIMSAFNPTVNFKNNDVERLPLFPIDSAEEIFAKLEKAFTEHEAARETSVEFKQPGRSAWNYAQDWAQQAVDREPGTPLPGYQPIYEELPPTKLVSYAIGVALGRFGANGEGILNETPTNALPNGILYLSTYSEKDSLQHPACQIIKDTWTEHNNAITKNSPLKKWLRESFFKDVHLGMYESRPIYFPLSSAKKNFVAFISIHRWQDNTLQTLLADYLLPELNTIEGELSDLIDARHQGDKKDRAKAEKRYSEVQKLYEELKTFCDKVSQCAEQGPPPANPKDTPREADARFQMDLDDGVMINSAALWSLLEPQWTKPKTWWSELCNPQGKKDYDWAHLAARYFPKRVDEKCQKDPSLAVAHGCFWKYHPVKAYTWELRLQDEIDPDFTIDEENSDALRQEFEEKHPQRVEELIEAEEKRRERKRKKSEDDDYGPLFDEVQDDE